MALPLYKMELQIPTETRGLVLGKGGQNIRKYQATSGISQVKLLPCGKLIVGGTCKEAVTQLYDKVTLLISRSQGFVPDLFIFCFCHSLNDAKLPVHALTFEEISYDTEYICFKTSETVTTISEGGSLGFENLALGFPKEDGVPESLFFNQWDFNVYKDRLLACLKKIGSRNDYQSSGNFVGRGDFSGYERSQGDDIGFQNSGGNFTGFDRTSENAYSAAYVNYHGNSVGYDSSRGNSFGYENSRGNSYGSERNNRISIGFERNHRISSGSKIVGSQNSQGIPVGSKECRSVSVGSQNYQEVSLGSKKYRPISGGSQNSEVSVGSNESRPISFGSQKSQSQEISFESAKYSPNSIGSQKSHENSGSFKQQYRPIPIESKKWQKVSYGCEKPGETSVASKKGHGEISNGSKKYDERSCVASVNPVSEQDLDSPFSSVKLIVRFGKQAFYGYKTKSLLGKTMSVDKVAGIHSVKGLKGRFLIACADQAIGNLKKSLGKDLGFVRVSNKKKISINCVHANHRFNVSLRTAGDSSVEGDESSRVLQASDHFEILGVGRDASTEEIKQAYRNSLLKIRFRLSDWSSSEKAETTVTAAFNCLMDPPSRLRHLKSILSKSNPSTDSKTLNSNKKDQNVEKEIIVSRVRRAPARHGFVSFIRPGGKDMTDFRLGISSHTDSLDVTKEMEEWVQKAWSKRNSDQRLVFEDCGDIYKALDVRYKHTETYVTEDFKLRVSWVENDNFAEEKLKGSRWECALSSRWFKWNDADSDSNLFQADIMNLIKHAVLVSQAMDVRIE